jgi:hypothetical protein
LVLAIVATDLWFSIRVALNHANPILYDFKDGPHHAGTAILRGSDPYQAGFLAHQATIIRAGGIALGEAAAAQWLVWRTTTGGTTRRPPAPEHA